MKKLLFFIPLLCIIILTGGCARPRVAFMPGYDFTQINQIGVLKFDSSQVDFVSGYDPGYMVADEFVLQFLNEGVRVVERSRLEEVLREHALWRSGDIDPETVKEMGKILGVDVLMLGTVTRYIPDEKNRIYVRDREGNVKEEIFLVDAEVSISARMVDVVTGEVIWAGAYSYNSFYIETAVRHAVNALFNSISQAINNK